MTRFGMVVPGHEAPSDHAGIIVEYPTPRALATGVAPSAVITAPLAGATFSLQGPSGNPPITCLTGADGIGTCKFAALPAGSYAISETTPPPGYASITLAGVADAWRANFEAFDPFPAGAASQVADGTYQFVVDGNIHQGGKVVPYHL